MKSAFLSQLFTNFLTISQNYFPVVCILFDGHNTYIQTCMHVCTCMLYSELIVQIVMCSFTPTGNSQCPEYMCLNHLIFMEA